MEGEARARRTKQGEIVDRSPLSRRSSPAKHLDPPSVSVTSIHVPRLMETYAVSRMESTDREKERRKYPSCPHPTRYMRMRWNESGRSAALSSIEKIWISFPISDVSWHFAGRRVAGGGVFNETRTIQRNAIRYFVRRIRDPTLLPCVSVRRRGGFLCGYTKLRSIMVGRLVSFKRVWLWLISLNDSLVVTYMITYVCTIWV